jgi:tetratricopeptide (TPR) repeat protein
LELARRWKSKEQPSQAWAHRYDKSFNEAMEFLARSERSKNSLRTQWRRLQGALVVLGAMLLLATWGFLAYRTSVKLAEANLADAVRAVDESLALVARDPTRIDADHPEVVALRRDLAEKARNFYSGFISRGYSDERLRQAVAATHFNLGHANRVLDDVKSATEEYRLAVEAFEGLARDYPASPRYRQSLANSYTFLGETLGLSVGTDSDARKAYDAALSIQQQLRREHPDIGEYRRDLASTYYNRGGLHLRTRFVSLDKDPRIEEFKLAEADFREAIALLQPLLLEAASSSQDALALSRAFNELGTLVWERVERVREAETLFERAVRIGEALVKSSPADRQPKLELSGFYSNLSSSQSEMGQLGQAAENSKRARALLEELARPAPSLSVELAAAHTVSGAALERQGWAVALPEYQRALEIFEDLDRNLQASHPLGFHLRFGDLLVSLAILADNNRRVESVRTALSRASDSYLSVCERVAKSGDRVEAQSVLETVSRFTSVLSESDRRDMARSYLELEASLRERAKN